MADKDVRHAKIYLLGLTFKENCPDTRNSRVVDIIQRLAEYGISVQVVDPWADKEAAMHEYGVQLITMSEVQDADCVALCVAHREFVGMGVDDFSKLYKAGSKKVFVDVKSVFEPKNFAQADYAYWSM